MVDDNKNRSLPQNLFCKLLSDKFGIAVGPGGIHKALQRSFGNDASAKSLQYLGMLQGFLQQQAQSQANTRNASTFAILAKLIAMCMKATPTQVCPPSVLSSVHQCYSLSCRTLLVQQSPSGELHHAGTCMP